MNIFSSVSGTRSAPRRRGAVLRLTACDDRIVPDGSLPAPPAGWDVAGQSPPPDCGYSATVQAGEWAQVGAVGGREQWFTLDSHARQWLFTADPSGGAFTAVLLNYDGSYDPSQHPLTQTAFGPAAGKWDLVWNPDNGTWTTVPPDTVFPAGITGFTSGDWNYVHLPRQLAPRPANPPQPGGGVAVTVTAGGIITITTPTETVTMVPFQDGGVLIVMDSPGSQPVIVYLPSPTTNPPILWAGSNDSQYFGATDVVLGVGEKP